jgi:PQQ-dependent dehydrogenase (s-GDH family)
MTVRINLSRAASTCFFGCTLLGFMACGSNENDAVPADLSDNEPADGSGNRSEMGGAAGAAGQDEAPQRDGGAGQGGAEAEAGVDPGGASSDAVGSGSFSTFSKRVVVEGLGHPWEITWGPDAWLWVTERTGKRVLRIQPSDGQRSVAIQIDEVRQTSGQDGLLGMALHPQLLKGTNQDFVYVAYSYDAGNGPRFKVRRYTYDAGAGTLGAPLDLLTNLPASTDHNAGRLIMGPDGMLYYAIGDQGENQFDRKCNLDRAQDLPTAAQVEAKDWQLYQGKILRMNLDGSIPQDNPVINGVKSHILTFGHRNPQGLAFDARGMLFSAEQGPKSDDELNRLEAGRNYGWPYVAGYRDDKAYVYANWSAASDCQQREYSDYTIPSTVPQQKESEWSDANFMAPLATFYTVEPNHNFQDPKCGAEGSICWPTIAPSSLEFYSAAKAVLAGWSDSLLITSLKKGTVYRVPLSSDGKSVSPNVTPLFKTTNRYRDLAVNPDGQTFYVVTDNDGSTSSPDGGATSSLENKGAVLEFRAAP